LFRTDPGNGDPHCLLSRQILFQGGLMDRTTAATQTAICYHIIHDIFPGA